MSPPRKRRLSTYYELPPPSHRDILRPNSLSLRSLIFLPAHVDVQLAPWMPLHIHKQSGRFSFSTKNTSPSPKNAPTLFLFAYSALSSLLTSVSPSVPQLLSKAPFISPPSNPLRQPAPLTDPTQNLRFAVLQKEEASRIGALSSHTTALNKPNNVLKKRDNSSQSFGLSP